MGADIKTCDYTGDILKNARMGFWAIENDDTSAPKMYLSDHVSEYMGYDTSLAPEALYDIWSKNIDVSDHKNVLDAIRKMYEFPCEIEYTWYAADGKKVIVRFDGMRDKSCEYARRVYGTCQNISGFLDLNIDEHENINKIVTEIVRGSDAAFILDLYDNSFRTLINRPQTDAVIKSSENYKSVVNLFVKKFVHPLDYQKFDKLFGEKVDLKKSLKIGEACIKEYRSNITGAYTWHRVRVTRVSERKVILDFSECDAEIMNDIVVNNLLSEYDAIYMVDIENDEVRPVIKSGYDNIGIICDSTKYSDLSKKFEERVGAKYRKDTRVITDVRFLRRFLAAENHREFVFSMEDNENIMWRVAIDVLERNTEFDPSTLMFSFKKLDAVSANEIRYKEELLKNERYNSIIRTLSENYDYICHIDMVTHEITRFFANKTIEGFFNSLPAEMTKHERLMEFWNKCVLPDDLTEFLSKVNMENIKTILQNTPKYSVDFRMGTASDYHWYRLRFACEVDNRGLLMALFSIDREKRSEYEIKEAYKKAEAASEAKTKFLFNMSHDIRTPMNAIIGYNSMALRNLNNPEKVKDCLTKSGIASEALLSIINDILEMSRIENGTLKSEAMYGDVYLSFAHIKDMAAEMAHAKDISLTFSFQNIKNRYVYCDIVHMNRIFANIIGNAIKYTPDGGYVKVVCEEIEADRPGYCMFKYSFEDNGIGMSKEFQEHMYERFTRENSETVTKVLGTGLGLAICKSYADLIGATITCESQKYSGTTFTVKIPCRIQEGEMSTNPEMLYYADFKKELKGKRVLLAEDNEMNREIVSEILREEGILVTAASDGNMALKYIEKLGITGFDIMILDIQMPFMDGYETARYIRKTYPNSDIPILALSANAFDEDKKKSYAAGMNDHLSKPVDVKTLVSTIAKYCK